MDTNELRSLQEAYLEVVEGQQLDEITASMGRRAKEYNRKKEQDAHMARQKAHQDKMKNDPEYAAKRKKIDAAASSRMGKGNPRYDASAAGSSRVKGFKFTPTEEVSVYDIVLSHLLDEGYADTVESAEGIMLNMSKEWRDSIAEAYQEPRFGKKDYIKKLSKRGGMGMGTPDDPHGYRDPKMAKVGAELSKRKTAAAKAKKTGEPDSYRAEKEAQSKRP